MKRSLLLTVVAATLIAGGRFVPSASAQILFSGASPYTQNFDSLGTVSNAWNDNTTIVGWYASRAAGSVTGYRADSGTSTSGALYSYGVAGVNTADERALGSVGSNSNGNQAYGVRFQNDTDKAVTNLTVAYTGEQWRNGGNTAVQTLAFSYFISSSPITSSDAAGANAWITVSSLGFNSPIVGSSAAALDGNAPANRQVIAAVLLTNVVVFPGQEIFLRWFDPNDSGNDHGLALDDLTVSYSLVTAVTNAPSIAPAGQPTSRTNNAGTRATFTVTASGSAPNYLWQRNEIDLTDGATGNGSYIYGSTTPSLMVSNALAGDAASYRVIVSNGAGSVTSAVAVLTVIDPGILTQPASRTNLQGDTANFFVSAAGTGSPLLTYQWRFNGGDISGATLSSYNVTDVQSGKQGSYSVVVGNNDFTVNYTTSQVAVLTMLSTPSTRLARWDFNATNSITTNTPTPSSGTGSATLVGTPTGGYTIGTYSDPAGLPGDLNSGWNTANYPVVNAGNKTSGVQFNVSTLGYQNILLSWEERHSDTASKYTRVQYSTDGVNFIDGDRFTMLNTNNGWVFYTSDLTSAPGVNNNANFAFRIVSEWEATAIGNNNSNYVGTVAAYSTGGTIRVDLVSVFGNTFTGVTPIPLVLTPNANQVVLSWSNPSFALQAAPVANGTYTNIPGATSPYTNPVTGSQKFFRLKY